MTPNQTIDGVPRELLEKALRDANTIRFPTDWQVVQLRALLDAPVIQEPMPQYFIEACDKFDWTPEEALRFYAEGKHFDTVNGRTRILCTGAIASHALKGMGEGYAAMKGIEPAAHPQGEPVERQPDAIIEGVMTSVGISHAIYASTVTLKHGEQVKLYAEQPAPVAVVLPERKPEPSCMTQIDDDREASIWNACLDEVTRLNTKPICCGSCPGGCVIQAASK